jgi:hypothetical protein
VINRNIHFEVSVIDPSDRSTKTLRLTSIDAMGGEATQADGYEWEPVITEWPTRTVDVMAGGNFSQVSTDHGSISFSIIGNPEWAKLSWSGALGRIWIGEGDGLGGQWFEGSISGLEITDDIATVTLLGAEAYLDVELLSGVYLGTGGVEGPAGVRNRRKPWTSGECQNVEPVKLYEGQFWFYQFHGYGAADGTRAVYENALQLPAAKARVNTLAQAIAAAPAPGEWVDVPGAGGFLLGAEPTGKITADVGGAKRGTNFPTSLADIVAHLSEQAGIAASGLDTASLAAFDQPWCAYVSDETTVGDLVRRALYELGGYLISKTDGVLAAGSFLANSAPSDLYLDSSRERTVLSAPRLIASPSIVHSVRVGHSRCWSVHSANEVSGALTTISEDAQAARQAAEAAQEAAEQAQADGAVLISQINEMSEDAWLDRAEKKRLERDYAEASTTKTALVIQAQALGITTQVTSYVAAFDGLTAYLNGLSPAWNDGSAATPIDRAQFNLTWSSYVSRYVALQNKIADVTAARAGNAQDTADDAKGAADQAAADASTAIGKVDDVATDLETVKETVEETVTKTTTLQQKFATLDAAFQGAESEIADLQATYGSTAAAAASADAAAQHEANAQTAATNAAQAKTDAEKAETDAVAAKTAAETARGQAQTAATNAGTANTNAQSAKTAAESAKSAAQAAKADTETAFANSTTAKNAAQAAQTAAETAKSQAQTQASNAAGSATAAAGSASTASTKATDAAKSATAASASQVSAQSAADDSQDSADAAATSASAASTSASAAGQSATAAQNSATTATTQAGKASTSATNAATSETNAKGSENAAKSSQTAAATSATTAGQKADAAATSASTASTKATEASQSASTATTQANTAITKAGEASTSASQAATSETNANASKNAAATSATNAANSANAAGGSATAAAGSASTASTKASESGNSAAVASAQALTAASHAAGNLIKKGVFSDGSVGEWGGSVSTITTGFTPPDGSTRVLQLKNRDSYEGELSPWPFSTERKVRLTGHLLSFGAYKASMGVQIQDAAGTNNWILRGATPANSKVWSYIDEVVTIPATTAKIRYCVVSDGASGASDHDLRATGLSVTDVTDSTAAAGSASAAATSASAAGTSATNAGTSANSATQSANTASSKANEAAASASSAANSASSASSSSNAAGNSATAANSSDVSAKLTAASQMPSDFQQDGKFWQNGFGGLPASLTSITPNSTFSFVNNSDVGRTMRVTASTQTDVSQIGMIQLQPDRIYRISAKVRQQSGSVFAQLQLYRIGVNSTGGTLQNGTVQSTYTFTALNQWVEMSGTVPASTTNAMIAAGASSIRSLLRLMAASSTVTVDYSYVRIEDITESTGAAGSASAAANSASQASASQAGAASSASSAQTNATNAATSAGQASTSASQASTSANNAAGSANTASTQASNAANSASAAGGSASAAQSSASTASTQASNAANSAAVASSQALYASSRAAGNLVAKPTFEDGDKGMWTGTVSVVADANSAIGTSRALRSQARDAAEGDFIPMPGNGVRILRVSGYAKGGSSASYPVNVGIQGQLASGSFTFPYSRAANAGVTTWTAFDFNLAIPATVLRFKPFVQSQNDAGQAGSIHDARVVALRIEDITESNSAAGSASAAASSASTASTKAGEAGQSATSASNSANTANIRAGEASSSASAAAGSAATASSAASTATTQANLTAQYSTAGGNLLQNTDFAVDTSGWWTGMNSQSNVVFPINGGGNDWHPEFANAISIYQQSSGATGSSDWMQNITVQPNQWYDVSVLVAAHRCQVQIYLQFQNASGGAVSTPSSGVLTPLSGGTNMSNWTQVGFKGQAPADAVKARLYLRKFGTFGGQADSWAWFLRPQVRETFATAPTPCAYSPGGSGAVAASQQATINTQQTAIATANSTIANHTTRLQAAEANVSQTMGAVSDIRGRTTAFFQVDAVAAGNRAQLRLVADANGGAGVDIIGDLRISGNAMIGGTINPEALDLSRFVKKIGPASANASDARLMYAADLGVTIANGSYQLTGSIGFTYTSGRQTMTQSGKPYYIDYLNDGGLLIALTKNGQTIAQKSWTGTRLSVYGAQNFSADITTIFDDLDLDNSVGNVTLAVYSRKGSSDTGMINEGDYYRREMSGNYYNFSMSNVKCKWTLW